MTTTNRRRDDPKYWRDAAEEVEVMAAQAKDDFNRRCLFNIAECYRAIADATEERADNAEASGSDA